MQAIHAAILVNSSTNSNLERIFIKLYRQNVFIIQYIYIVCVCIYIYIYIYIYKMDLALNKLLELIYYKTQPTKRYRKFNNACYGL